MSRAERPSCGVVGLRSEIRFVFLPPPASCRIIIGEQLITLPERRPVRQYTNVGERSKGSRVVSLTPVTACEVDRN